MRPIQYNTNTAHDDMKEFAGIIQYHDDVQLSLPTVSYPGPKYRMRVDRIKLRCSNNTMVLAKTEYFDASKQLVYLGASDPTMLDKLWQPLNPLSPITLLRRIVCSNEAFSGIGVEVAMDGKLIKVVRVIEGTPAQKAGVTVNDIVTHLDDDSVDGMTLNQAVEKMRGEANTKIKLRIVREGQSVPIELSVTRGVVQRPSVQPSVQAPSVQPSMAAPSAPWPSVQTRSVQWPSVQVPSVQWPSVQGQVQQ
jgi:hypothetical protein